MDAYDRGILLRFLYWGDEFERSRLHVMDLPHRGYRQWVREAPKDNRQPRIDARAAAPEGLLAYVQALTPYFPIYREWLAVAYEREPDLLAA